MPFTEEPAGPDLAPYVESFWTLDCGRGCPTGEADLVVPDGCVEIVFSRGGEVTPPHPTGAAPPAPQRAFVLGLTTGPTLGAFAAGGILWGVRLRPAGVVRLFGDKTGSIRDGSAPAAEMLPRALHHLPDVVDGGDPLRARSGLTAGLTDHFARCRVRPVADRLARAMALILHANGRVRIEDVARESGLSSRQLGRCFERGLGLCPKTYSRLARFRSAWSRAWAPDRGCWAGLAHRCGYSDQSHLCRDFREFAGLTPGALGAPSGP